jgi:hypothetical protein
MQKTVEKREARHLVHGANKRVLREVLPVEREYERKKFWEQIEGRTAKKLIHDDNKSALKETMAEERNKRTLKEIKSELNGLYPEDGSKPDPVKAARVRKELLDCVEKSPKDVRVAVRSCLDGVILRAVFDAASNDALVRQRAYGYFTSVREKGTEIEADIAVAHLCDEVKLLRTADLEVVATEQIVETGKLNKFNAVKMNDRNGRVQMVEFDDLIGRNARMLMTLRDPRAIEVLFETGLKLRGHPLYVELGARLTEIAKFIQENEKKKKEAAKEFKKYVATEPPMTFEC